MKYNYLFFTGFLASLVVGICFSYVQSSIAQEKVQQVVDVACVVSDVVTFKNCIQKIQEDKSDFVKITSLIQCQNRDDCAVELSNIKRAVLIYGVSADTGFQRINTFDYPIFTIKNSSKISIGGMLFDDTQGSCSTGTICSPAISLHDSDHILIESLIVKSAKETAVLVQGGKQVTIKNSTFDGSENHAVKIQNSEEAIITGNKFVNSGSNALVIASLGSNVISNNTFTHNNWRFFTNCDAVCVGGQVAILPNTDSVTIKHNTIQDGSIDGYDEFGLTTSGIEIEGQNINDISISCNTISKNSGNGIVLVDRGSSFKTIKIENNTFLENGLDLNVHFSSSDKIEGNCFGSACSVKGC